MGIIDTNKPRLIKTKKRTWPKKDKRPFTIAGYERRKAEKESQKETIKKSTD